MTRFRFYGLAVQVTNRGQRDKSKCGRERLPRAESTRAPHERDARAHTFNEVAALAGKYRGLGPRPPFASTRTSPSSVEQKLRTPVSFLAVGMALPRKSSSTS